MRACSSSHICFYIVKVVHIQVCTYMCVRMSPCACVFEFVDLFAYDEGCA